MESFTRKHSHACPAVDDKYWHFPSLFGTWHTMANYGKFVQILANKFKYSLFLLITLAGFDDYCLKTLAWIWPLVPVILVQFQKLIQLLSFNDIYSSINKCINWKYQYSIFFSVEHHFMKWDCWFDSSIDHFVNALYHQSMKWCINSFRWLEVKNFS